MSRLQRHGKGRARASDYDQDQRGVDTGSVLPLRGEGNAGVNGGPNGDVLVFINVKPHELSGATAAIFT
jgi:DnaJ-class molecular chaperone